MSFLEKIAAVSNYIGRYKRDANISGFRNYISYINLLMVSICFFLFVEGANAQTYVWTGNVNSDWNVAANWDRNRVPDNNSSVVVAQNSSGVYPIINTDVSVSDILISRWGQGGKLTVTNGVIFTIGKNLTIEDLGELLIDNATVQFNGKGNNGQSIDIAYHTSVQIVNSGVFNSPDAKLTINTELVLESGKINLGDGFQLSSGAVFNVAKGDINIFGGSVINGTLNGGVGNFVFNGDSWNGSHKVTIKSGGKFFMAPSSSGNYPLICTSDASEPSGGSVDFYTPCDIGSSGFFYGGNADVTFYKSVAPSGTAIIETHNGTLLFKEDLTASNTANVNITCEGTIQVDGDTRLYSSGYIDAVKGNIYFRGDVKTENSSGTINAGASTIVFSGGSFVNEGYFNPGTSTFIFNGNGNQQLSTYNWRPDNTFYNLVIEGGSNVQSTHNLMVLNDLNVNENGTLNIADGKTLDVVGSVLGEDGVFTNRPYIVSIVINSSNEITAVFNEPLDPGSSQSAWNYWVENESGNTIDHPSNPTLGGSNNNEVSLTLGFSIVPDASYYLIGNNIKNLNNNTVNSNHRKRFIQSEPANLWRWAGTIDSDWDKSQNWVKNKLPQTDSHVIIPITQNNPVISSEGNLISELEIKNGASLTIGSTGNLTVDNNISNEAGENGLVISSDVDGTGSLIHFSNAVPATFQRYISGAPQTWQMISSPVEAQEISGNFTPTGGSDAYGDNTRYDFYSWYEPDTSWVYLLNNDVPPTWLTSNNNSNSFLPGKGYLISYKDSHPTKEFVGNLNNGSVSVPLYKTTGAGTEFGFNFVGNPYPSSIDWKSSGWGRNLLENNGGGFDIWIWSETNQNYGAYNSASDSDNGTLGVSRYIAPTQGFFVKASQSGLFSMNNSLRVHEGSGNWLKSAASDPDRIIVDIESDDGYGKDEVVIEFGHSEPETGTIKRFSFVPSSPSLFIENNSKSYSIRLLGEKDEYPVLPVSFKAGEKGKYKLSFSFNSNAYEVFKLYDRNTGEWSDIGEGEAYSFDADSDDNPNRFVLQIMPGNYADPNDKLPVLIYPGQGNLTVDLRLVEGTYTCEIYTLTGQKLMIYNLTGGQISQFKLPSANSVVIVQVVGQNGRKIEKVPIVY